MVLSASLPGLTPREAVVDALYRVVQAYDLANDDLYNSGLTEDVVITGFGNPIEGRDAMRIGNYDFVKTLDTTHFLSNFRVDVKEGDKQAKLSCNAQAFHYRPGTGKQPGAPRLVSGARYFCDLVLDERDGLWKVNKWHFDLVWTDGDYSVMKPQ